MTGFMSSCLKPDSSWRFIQAEHAMGLVGDCWFDYNRLAAQIERTSRPVPLYTVYSQQGSRPGGYDKLYQVGRSIDFMVDGKSRSLFIAYILLELRGTVVLTIGTRRGE